MSWTVIEADGNGVRETRRGGTLTGEVEGEVKQKALTAFRNLPPDYTPIYIPPWQDRQPEGDPKPKLVTWRLCNTHGFWFPSNKIPKGWVALEAHTQPVETVKQLPEGQEP
jgi:hypothetical protein